MGSAWQDLKYAFRALRKRPSFTLVAILIISLGIGANTAIFSVVNGVLLTPLPVRDPGGLVVPNVISTLGFQISLSIPNFKDWRERNRTFESFGANATRNLTLTSGDRPEVLQVRIILGDFFETAGVAPALGRIINSDETWAGAEPIAVVTHRFWQEKLDADENALDHKIVLNGQPYTVVGVMPEDFLFPSATTEVFLPMGFFSNQMCWENRGCSQGTWAIGRLKEGIDIETAQADLDRVVREITAEEGEEPASPQLQSLKQAYVGDIERHVWILMAAVGFVLLIACANVGSLLLARAEGRRREIAVRTALGASRGTLIRQLLTESMVLAGVSGIVGVGLGWLGVKALVPAISDNIPTAIVGQIGIDGGVLGFSVGATALAGLLFGLLPAVRSSTAVLTSELKEGGRDTVGRSRQRLRSALVVAEVALSLVLLIGAALMIQSLTNLSRVDKGFSGENVFVARLSLPRYKYEDQESTWRFYETLVERMQSLPGVTGASVSNIVPLQGNSWERSIWAEGVPIERETANSVLFHMVTPDHFDVLGVPLKRGRWFGEQDREGAPLVAIIDETMAEKFWPGEDPIGKRVTFEEAESSTEENPVRVYRTVIGVAQNVRHYELENPSRIQVYVPVGQSGRSFSRSMHLLVKTEARPLAITETVRREVSALDADVPLFEVETADGYVEEALAGTKVVGGLLGIFSGLALLLSSIGIFGVMAYSVVQRLREIGIRMALGARGKDVVWMVARQGLTVTSLGVVTGLVAAFGLTRVMSGLLYQVDPLEPTTFAIVSLSLVAVSLVASLVPAGRAVRVDPALVLKEE